MILEAFILGISSGSYCIFSCAPVAVPLFISEDLDRKKSWRSLGLFLGGRLIGYLLFGFIIGLFGAYVVGYFDPYIQQKLESVTMIILGFTLLLTAIPLKKGKRLSCLIKAMNPKKDLAPVVLGLLTGLSFCPPFFVAAGRVFGTGGSFTGLIYFLFFFLGTSLFMLPLGGFYLFSKFREATKFIGKYLRVMVGVYFIIFLGLLNLTAVGGC